MQNDDRNIIRLFVLDDPDAGNLYNHRDAVSRLLESPSLSPKTRPDAAG